MPTQQLNLANENSFQLVANGINAVPGLISFYSLLKTFLFARAWAGSASE